MSLSSLGTLVARIARKARPDETPPVVEPSARPTESTEVAPEIIPEPENVLGEVATYVCRDGMLSHLARDECIGRSLHYYGEWGFREIELLRTFVKPGDTVLDIGANVGTHTIALGRLVGEQGAVLAFEGQPLIHSILAHNIVQNGMSKWVHAFNMLVGSAQRLVPQALLPTNEMNNTGAKSFFHDVNRSRLEQNEPTVWLAMATIDQLDLPRCDLMKIDLNHAEPIAFQMVVFEVTFLVLATANAAAYGLMASMARKTIRKPSVQRAVNRTGGSLMIGAGLLAVGWKRAAA